MELTLDQALQKGIQAHKTGQLHEADRLYTAILKIQPKHPDANHNLGLLAVGVGNVEVALPFFNTALNSNPYVSQYWLSFIEALIKLDRLDDAKAAFDQANQNSAKGEAFNLLERRLRELTQSDDSSSSDNKNPSQSEINILDSKSVNQALRYAKSKSKEGLIKDAIRIYQNVIDRFPKNKSALEGIKTLSGGIVAGEVSSEPKSYQLQPLIDLHHQHQYQSLLVEAAQMLRQFPKSANLYNILGIANAGLKLFDAALDCYKKAIKLNPSYTVIHNNIGNVLRDLGNLEGSIESYKKVIKLNPKSVDAYYNIGKSFGDMGNLNGALDYYKQAIIINPNYTDAHYNMGRILHNKGDFVGALSCFKLTLRINPNYVEAYISMGFTFGETGNLEAAVENYNKVIKIKPRNASAWDSLAFPLQTMKHLIPFENEFQSRLPDLTNSKYAQTEKAILKYKLNLGTSDSENSLNQVLGFLSDTENIIIKNPKGSDKKYAQKTFEQKKIVTLVHFGRSGTGLLHDLIDGHSEVSTLPSRYLSEFFDRSSWENIIADGWSNAVERFITIYGAFFDASPAELTNTKDQKLNDSVFQSKEIEAVSEQKNEVLNADKTVFGNELNRLMETYDQIDAFIFFKLVHIAYNKSISDHNYKSLIFYHIHNPSIYAQLNFLRLVPKANWVMMVREPLQSCESWIREKFFDNDYTQVSLRIVTMLFEIDKIIYHQHKSIGVRLEDLKEHPKKTIRALCSWMDIEETETLYQIGSHSNKLANSVNSDFKSHVKDPFGKASINRQVGSIFSENDQYILRTLFYPFSVRFGYVKESFEQFKMDLQSIRPMLDQMFDFEKKIMKHMQVDSEQFKKRSSYLYFRTRLIERWTLLNQHHTYPNMLMPLKIVTGIPSGHQ